MLLQDKVGDKFAILKLLYIISEGLKGRFFEVLFLSLFVYLTQHC